MKRCIDVLLFDGVNMLDVAGPIEAFNQAKLKTNPAYEVHFVALEPGPVTSSCGLQLTATRAFTTDSASNDLLLPGGKGVDDLLGNQALNKRVAGWLTERPKGRIISICSGALLLADAQVLDGKSATTHWSREFQIRRLFPRVNWTLDRIYTRDGNIFTSAGVTTGIDLALSILKEDCGSQCALDVARELVVYLQRSGGQNQYAQLIEGQFSAEKTLANVINKLIEQPQHDWSLELLADVAGVTPRTLTRKFKTNLNTSPMKFLELLRVRLANDLLSAGMPVKHVSRNVGFKDIQTMRRAYKRQLGSTLGEYVERFSQVH